MITNGFSVIAAFLFIKKDFSVPRSGRPRRRFPASTAVTRESQASPETRAAAGPAPQRPAESADGITMSMLFDQLGRRRTIVGFYSLAVASIGLLALATDSGSTAAVLLAFVVANALCTGAWTSAYPTFTELFPAGR
jgi:hypothetical protein